jgi:hypothetical protein
MRTHTYVDVYDLIDVSGEATAKRRRSDGEATAKRRRSDGEATAKRRRKEKRNGGSRGKEAAVSRWR